MKSRRASQRRVSMLLVALALGCGARSALDVLTTASHPIEEDATVPVVDAASVPVVAMSEPANDAAPGSAADADAGVALDAAPQPDAPPEADGPQEAGCTVCPASPPTAGEPCASDGLRCEYGSDPRPFVNQIADCVGGRWSYPLAFYVPLTDSGRPASDGGCPATYDAALSQDPPCSSALSCVFPGQGTCTCSVSVPDIPDAAPFWLCIDVPAPAGCPPSLAEAQTSSQACPVNGFICNYPGGMCICYVDDSGVPWACTAPDPDAGCPPVRPRIGSPCTVGASGNCIYTSPACSGDVVPNGRLYCGVPQEAIDASTCSGVWMDLLGAFCQ